MYIEIHLFCTSVQDTNIQVMFGVSHPKQIVRYKLLFLIVDVTEIITQFNYVSLIIDFKV